MGLIAGSVDEYRNIQHFDHLLNLGRVKDHGGLNGQITALVYQKLIIRLAVLSSIKNLSVVHGSHRILNLPAGCLSSA